MVRLEAGKARDTFDDTIQRVARRGERILLRRRGRDVAALVSVKDLRLLERLTRAREDQEDADAAAQALRDMKAKGEKPIPWQRAKKQLGL